MGAEARGTHGRHRASLAAHAPPLASSSIQQAASLQSKVTSRFSHVPSTLSPFWSNSLIAGGAGSDPTCTPASVGYPIWLASCGMKDAVSQLSFPG